MTAYRNVRVFGADGLDTGRRSFGVSGRSIDLGGAIVTPGFVDAHVHMTGTGLSIEGLDLHSVTSAKDLAQALLEFVRRDTDRFVVGHGWDDTAWPAPPTRALVDGVAGERLAYLARVDGHSALVSSTLLKDSGCEQHEGVDRDAGGSPTGIVRRDANQAARAYLFKKVPLSFIRAAHRRAAERAVSLGITTVHEMAGPYFGAGERELDLWEKERLPVNVVVYYSTDDFKMIRRRGLKQVGGDFNVDGALGSRTAALSKPYTDDRTTHGFLYRDADACADFFEGATRAGLQAGVHCIGEAACEAAVTGLERAARRVGAKTLRHRLEHFEMAGSELIARAVRAGATLSVQPAFDAFWGGRGGMYAKRVGVTRARSMNDFRAAVAAGATLIFGSDSPVTPLDPLGAIAAATFPHVRSHAISPSHAWRAMTGGAEFSPGDPADFVVWDGDPVKDPQGAKVRATFTGGRLVYGAL